MSTSESQSTEWTFVLDEPTRILVVDDDPILCEFASVHLSTPATTIDCVGDGATALAVLERREAPDIVLLDIEMPGFDGFALLERIRADERLKDLPVVMLTSHEDIGSIDRAYRLGATSFATKPVNWRQLSYHLRYVLRASRLEGRGAPPADVTPRTSATRRSMAAGPDGAPVDGDSIAMGHLALAS